MNFGGNDQLLVALNNSAHRPESLSPPHLTLLSLLPNPLLPYPRPRPSPKSYVDKVPIGKMMAILPKDGFFNMIGRMLTTLLKPLYFLGECHDRRTGYDREQ